MSKKYKLIDAKNAAKLGQDLKKCRVQKGYTLKDSAIRCGVHFGQLSRFEVGEFKAISKNLQKYASFLQIDMSAYYAVTNVDLPALSQKVSEFISRSPKHLVVMGVILEALEKFEAIDLPD
ncbi:MAG: helix-turn-helix transcriptional regulator [Methylomonas sp.]|jgi:transcriptional regulator with XRE-family HTH domain